MKPSYPKTNDYRLIGHLKKITGVESDADTAADMLLDIDSSGFDFPGRISDILVVYDAFPVFGEFMFPKRNSYLWNLIESTDKAMLLTDAMIQSSESLFVCMPLTPADIRDKIHSIIDKQATPTLCVNSYRDYSAVLFNLSSLRV